ncbi:MAG: hypothetical protein WDZ76_05035 [Pseudohongiellaceae bacterium]
MNSRWFKLGHLAPFLYFPLLLVLITLFDTLFGDRQFLRDIGFMSRRLLLERGIADYLASLLPFVALYVLLVIPFYWAAARAGKQTALAAAVILILLSTVAISLVTGSSLAITLAFTFAAGMIFLLLPAVLNGAQRLLFTSLPVVPVFLTLALNPSAEADTADPAANGETVIPVREQATPSSAIIMVGGGNLPDNSQAQIELNVQWVNDIVQRRAPESEFHLLYTDGDGPVPDVQEWAPVSDAEDPYQVIARVYGSDYLNGYRYRDNRLSAPTIASGKSSLTRILEQQWLDPEQTSTTLIYNGHGSFGGRDTRNNALMLWNDERLSVNELDAIADRRPEEQEFRFILTQCFSGAFASIAWNQGGKVCGFMAESPYRESEGCSASIDTNDYRDYTTYFYAAIDGATRHGEPLATDPDLDGDGEINFREAHLYTLGNAVSTDLSRSTSEVYLEEWEPWFLRWTSFLGVPENEYSILADQVAANLDLAGEDATAAALAEEDRLTRENRALLGERTQLDADIQSLQVELQTVIELYWPQLKYPRTASYHTLLNDSIPELNGFITSQPAYGKLVTLQEEAAQLGTALLENERLSTQVKKMFRLRKLARLQTALERFGSPEEQEEYGNLQGCEAGGTLQ